MLATACRPQSAADRKALSDLVVSSELCGAPGPQSLRGEDLQADFRVVQRVMERGYAGFDDLSYQDWVAAVASAGVHPVGDVTPLQARDWFVDQLGFAQDNHLGFWIHTPEGERLWRATSDHLQAHVSDVLFDLVGQSYIDSSGARLMQCDGQPVEQLMRATLRPGTAQLAHRMVKLSTQPVQHIRCRLVGRPEPVTYALRPMRTQSKREPVFRLGRDPYPWVRLRSLMLTRRGSLERFVESSAKLLGEPVVILDLRGAGGGSDGFLLRWFKALSDDKRPYFETRELNSEVTAQGLLNFWRCTQQLADSDAEGGQWLARRVDRARQALGAVAEPHRHVRERRQVTTGQASTPFAGWLILWVDRGCTSACETAVLLARQFSRVWVVGENTEGTMKVGEIRWYRLPRSGVWMSAGSRVHRDPREDGFPEGLGYRPDLWIDGERAEASVTALAACLAGGACDGDAGRLRWGPDAPDGP